MARSAIPVLVIILLGGLTTGATYWRYGPGLDESTILKKPPAFSEADLKAQSSADASQAAATALSRVATRQSPPAHLGEFADWNALGLNVAGNAAKSPDGTQTASILTADTAFPPHSILAGVGIDNSKPARATLYARSGDGGRLSLSLSAGASKILCEVDLGSGTVMPASLGNGRTQSCTAIREADGWFHIVLTGTVDSGGNGKATAMAIELPSDSQGTANNTAHILIWHATAVSMEG